jgi:solute carrier family 25 protein 39/40
VRGWGYHQSVLVRRVVGIYLLCVKHPLTRRTMSIPSAAIYMIGYEHLLTRISPYFSNSTDPDAHISSIHRKPGSSAPPTPFTAAPLVAGALARTLSATTISPIEMFRTRLQALPSQGVSPSYASVFKDMSALVKAQNLTVLWRGLGPTLWRDVPFSGASLSAALYHS